MIQILLIMVGIAMTALFKIFMGRLGLWIVRHYPVEPEETDHDATQPLEHGNRNESEQDGSQHRTVESRSTQTSPLQAILKTRRLPTPVRPRSNTSSTQETLVEDPFTISEKGKERALSPAELIKYGESQSRRLHTEDANPDVDDPFNIEELFAPLSPIKPLKISREVEMKFLREAEEIRLKQVQEYRQAQEAQKRAQEEQKLREVRDLARERSYKDLRWPMFPPVAPRWADLCQLTLQTSETEPLVKTADGTGLVRRDFASIVQPTEWLNDEIVNGALSWVDKAVNWISGIKDVKAATRRCLALNSFFISRLLNKGTSGTENLMRRQGVTRENFLDVDCILIPICIDSHWTLLVVRPHQKRIAHVDSLKVKGSNAMIETARQWVKDFLKDKYVEEDWTVVQYTTPRQTNGYDCGMHVILNALCIAIAATPIVVYKSEEMPQHRLRITSVLLNGGFTGEFSIWEE